MLSIQGFFTIVITFVVFVLLLVLWVLWLLLKQYRMLQNWEQRTVQDNKQPVALRRPLFLQDQWQYNNSVPRSHKRATENDEF